MKKLFYLFLMGFVMTLSGFAQIANPILDFKTGLKTLSGDKILKWECDLTGIGRKEVFFALKSEVSVDQQDEAPSDWTLYIPNAAGDGYLYSEWIAVEPKLLSRMLPKINTDICFVGTIDELGKRGIVTTRCDTLRSGEVVAKIYAYTIEDDHLKYTELLKYDGTGPVPALYTKYLSADKRTHVHIEELVP